MRYSNISAEEKKKGTMYNHYDWTSAMVVLSTLRASTTMGQRSPRTTSSDVVSLSIQLPPATTFRQTQTSEGGVQDSMSLDSPCAQRADSHRFLSSCRGPPSCRGPRLTVSAYTAAMAFCRASPNSTGRTTCVSKQTEELVHSQTIFQTLPPRP